jgi:hypothetical protein
MSLTTSTQAELQHRLQLVDAYLARLTQRVAKVEGERDTIIRQLTDNEGCDDRRFAVR